MLSESLLSHDGVAILAMGGSGKTIAAQLFASQQGEPVTWLRLDSSDRRAERFLLHLATSLRTMRGDASSTLEMDLRIPLDESAIMLAQQLESDHCLLVFDRCEVISGCAESLGLLRDFLDYIPPTVHALILSRNELDPPLARLVLEDRLATVDEGDLAFSFQEARGCVDSSWADDEVEHLLKWTHGWAAGVSLGARTGVTFPDGHSSFTTSTVAGYIQHEIFERLTPDEQRFLLHTSMLDEVSQDSAVVMCGPGAQRQMATIRTEYLPFTITPDRTLVYHEYFKEFLLDQLHRTEPDFVSELQRRQALVLDRSGRPEEAVELLLGCGELDAAAETAIRAVAALFSRGDWTVVLRWIETLGEARIMERPALEAARIRALSGLRRIGDARDRVRELWEEGRLATVAASDPGSIAHLVGWSFQLAPREGLALLDSSRLSDFRAEAVRYQLEVVSGEDSVLPPVGREWSEVERLLTWGLLIQGRLDDLVRLLPNEEHWPPRTYYESPHMLFALALRGELSRALELWQAVPGEIRTRVHRDLWRFLEAWLFLLKGDPDRALEAALSASAYQPRYQLWLRTVFQYDGRPSAN